MARKARTIMCGLLLILLGYLLLLIVPSPILDYNFSSIDIKRLLRRTTDQEYKEIKTSKIRDYCIEKLGVPYNYSSDSHNDTVKDHYYAKLNYVAQHLYINDDYKFIYLSVPKVACSNWKRLILRLRNVTDKKKLAYPHVMSDFKRLVDLPRTEWRAVLQDYGYYKFAFVRNPWTRLVSAYVDRFTRYDKWWYGYIQQSEGKRMIKNHRPGASQAEISSGSDVRFGEFVSDILDHQREAPNKTVTTKLNEHWNAQFFIAGLCHPWLEYDYIGRYEDLDTASLDVFQHVNLPEFIDSFPKPSRNSSTVRRASLEYSLLDPELLANLSIQLKPDLEMLGYGPPVELSHILPET